MTWASKQAHPRQPAITPAAWAIKVSGGGGRILVEGNEIQRVSGWWKGTRKESVFQNQMNCSYHGKATRNKTFSVLKWHDFMRFPLPLSLRKSLTEREGHGTWKSYFLWRCHFQFNWHSEFPGTCDSDPLFYTNFKLESWSLCGSWLSLNYSYVYLQSIIRVDRSNDWGEECPEYKRVVLRLFGLGLRMFSLKFKVLYHM